MCARSVADFLVCKWFEVYQPQVLNSLDIKQCTSAAALLQPASYSEDSQFARAVLRGNLQKLIYHMDLLLRGPMLPRQRSKRLPNRFVRCTMGLSSNSVQAYYKEARLPETQVDV